MLSKTHRCYLLLHDACEKNGKQLFPHASAEIDSIPKLQRPQTLDITSHRNLSSPKHNSLESANLAYFTEDTLYSGFEKVIMSEVTFAKTFLATLDKRPIKLPADHVGDPRKYPGQSPVNITTALASSLCIV